MLPVKHDISMYRGDYFEMLMRFRESIWDEDHRCYAPGDYVDLTGWTGVAQVRASADDDAVLGEFMVTILDQTDDATRGAVHLAMAPDVAQYLNGTSAVWDAQLTDAGGRVRTYAAGAVTVVKDVTRT